MKIVVLEGSPNKNGSSNLLANEFIRGAQEAGHSCTVIDAAHANLPPLHRLRALRVRGALRAEGRYPIMC